MELGGAKNPPGGAGQLFLYIGYLTKHKPVHRQIDMVGAFHLIIDLIRFWAPGGAAW